MCSNVSPEATLAPARTPGEEVAIAAGDQRAVVVTHGGGLRAYSSGTRQVIDGYRSGEPCRSGRGQVLIPWPNRLEDGSYEFDGLHHQLDLTEPEHGNAIHGLVREATWTVAEREPHRVVMEHLLQPQPGYPFTLALRIEYDAVSRRAPGLDDGDQRRPGRLPVRERRAPVPHRRHGDGRLGVPALSRVDRAPDRRARPSGEHPVGRRHRLRLPAAEANRLDAARPRLHRPRARRRRPGAGRARGLPSGTQAHPVGRRLSTAISCSSPATRWPTSTGAASPSSR